VNAVVPGRFHRFVNSLHRLSLLAIVLLLPVVFWTPFNDCFPLPKMLALALFGGLALVAGPWRIPPAFVWVFPWGVWTAGMSLLGPGVTSWWRTIPDAVVLILPPLMAFSASGSSPAFVRKLSAGLVYMASLIGGYGLMQTFGMDMGAWISPFHKGVASTIGNPDLLGGMLVFPFALAMAEWLESRSLYRAIPVAVIGVAIIATEARAAWLASFVAMAVLYGRDNRKAIAGMAAAGLVGVSAWLYVHPSAFTALISRSALQERVWTWKVSARSMRMHPVAGWGTGSFRTVFLREQATALAGLRQAGTFHYTEFAHFEPIHLWVETGAVGLGLFLWGLVSLFRGWHVSRFRRPLRGYWRGAGAGWAGLLTDGALSFPFHVPPTAAPAWVVPGSGIHGGQMRNVSGKFRLVGGLILLAGLTALFRLASASGYLRTGQALALDGRFLDAQAVYAKSVRLVPGDIRPWWYSAISARLGYSPTRSLEMAGRGLELEPAWAELHLERGMALKALGRISEAELAYRESVRFNPGFSHAWNNLGNLLGSQGRLVEAELAQRRALDLAPDSPEARRNLAVTLTRLGRKREAEAVMGGLPGQ